MARSRRVRQATSAELDEEFGQLYLAWRFAEVDQLTDAQLDHLAARLDRVGREIARRMYRFRAHGRECSCADCIALLDHWDCLRRRVEHSQRPWA